MYLPRAAESSRASEAVKDIEPEAPAAARDTILVVEDAEDVREFTVEVLRRLGYRVLEAADGRTALAILDAEPVSLLFTDVGLPNGMNGRQLAEEACRRKPALKVLYTTGYARNAIVHHGRLDPGVELLVKPFTQQSLASRVRQLLKARAVVS
jgi:CheY-like chemotaxis protein